MLTLNPIRYRLACDGCPVETAMAPPTLVIEMPGGNAILRLPNAQV